MSSHLRDANRRPASPRAGSRSRHTGEEDQLVTRRKRLASQEPSALTPKLSGAYGDFTSKSIRKDSLGSKVPASSRGTQEVHFSRREDGLRRRSGSVDPTRKYSGMSSSCYSRAAARLTSPTHSGSWKLDAAYPASGSTDRSSGRRSASCRRPSSSSSSSSGSDSICGPLPCVRTPRLQPFQYGSRSSVLSPTSFPSASSRSSVSRGVVRGLSDQLGSIDIAVASCRSQLKGTPIDADLLGRYPAKREFELGPGSGTCGLYNLGNTCYQNATMQVLAGIPELVEFFRTKGDWKRRSQRSVEIGTVITQMWSKPPKSLVSLKPVLNQLGKKDDRWSSYSQEDAHEFLTAILGALQDDCSRNTGKPAYKEMKERSDLVQQAEEAWAYSQTWHNSQIDDVFGFQLHSQLTCPKCSHQSNTFDYATDLELPIPDRHGQSATLKDCLDQLVTPELLSPENEWYCSKCRLHVLAKKTLSIYRTPQVLLVALKRFGVRNSCKFRAWKNGSNIMMQSNRVDFSSALSPLSSEKETCYDLCGVVDHAGTLTGGHYTARVKNAKTGHWFNFNDTQVREVAAPCGPESSGYTLVLRKSR
ncbi:hypothetical protein BSKO_02218 [Bryopsis sp. KO-2023]|nr:hypothetical protein BSKO_02218 [Bryopsis sp. KO-2023]